MLQEEGIVSLCTLGNPQVMCAICPRVACLPSLQEQGSTVRSLPQLHPLISKIPDFEPCWLQNLLKICPSGFFQPMDLGKCSVCFSVYPHYPLSATKALSPLQHLESISAPIHVSMPPTILDMASSLPIVVQFILSVVRLISWMSE